MSTRYFSTLILGLAVWAAPAFAAIQFSYCSSGCSDNTGTGTYAAWQSAPGSAGLAFSMSPLTFAAGGLGSGVFTDSTGTIFTGYNGASTDPLTVTGTSLAQTLAGSGTGIDITLPANTYAIAFVITTVSGFGSPVVELNDRLLNNSNYQLVIPNSTSPQFSAFLAACRSRACSSATTAQGAPCSSTASSWAQPRPHPKARPWL